MRKIAIALLAVLAASGIGKAQQCTATLATASEQDTFTGTAVTNGFTMSGGGLGESASLGFFEGSTATSASGAIPSGDFTLSMPVTSLSGGTTPSAGYWLIINGGPKNYTSLYIHKSNGQFTAYFDAGHKGSTTISWSNVGSLAISSLPATLSTSRSGDVLSFYVNGNLLGTLTDTSNPAGLFEAVAASGDITSLANAAFGAATVGGSAQTLTFSSSHDVVAGASFQNGAVTQGGTFNSATSVSGSVNISGCPSGVYAVSTNKVFLSSTQFVTVTSPNVTCGSAACSYSNLNPATGVDSWGSLTHGFQEQFNSTVTVTVYSSVGMALTSVVVPTVTVTLNP